MPGRTTFVQVEDVTIGKDKITRRSIGHMEAISSVEVKAAVDGFIQKPAFREGDIVNKGDILLTIGPIRYQAKVQQAEAAVEEINAKIIYAKNRHERLKRLAANKASSEAEAETAMARYEELLASKAQAEAKLARATKDLEDCTIRAEITGRIGRINYSPGNYITRGETLVTIKQMDPIYVRFPLSQYDVNSLFRGASEIGNVAQVHLTLANGRSYAQPGVIKIVDNILAGDSDTYTLWAEFSNPERALIPRGIGALHVGLADTQEVPMVPLTAVHYDDKGAYIYTLEETERDNEKGLVRGKVCRNAVSVGSIHGRLQSVYSGIKQGQTVITDGAHKIRVGDNVVGRIAIHKDTADQNSLKKQEEPPVTVTTAAVTTMQDPTVLTCHGARVEAINRVELRPLVQGILVAQNFREGDKVSPDTHEHLFRIDTTRYDAEVKAVEAQIARLEVSKKDAENKYKRQLELMERNATSKDEVESAKAQLDELSAQIKSAQAALILAKSDLSCCTIRVPMSGRIGRVMFSVGNYISDMKTPLATLVQVSPIYVRFYLSENEILSAYGTDEKLREDAEVTLITDTGNTFPEKGTIHFCDNIIKTTTDTQNIWATFDNTAEQLQPGAVVTIQVRRKADKNVPSVPTAAISTDSSGKYVYIMRHGRAVLTRILCGTKNTQTIHVWLNPQRMKALNITEQDVNTAITASHIQPVEGSNQTEDAATHKVYNVGENAGDTTLAEFRNIIVKTVKNGEDVKLADIAAIDQLTPVFAGLREGDKIILGPLAELEDGTAVKEESAQ